MTSGEINFSINNRKWLWLVLASMLLVWGIMPVQAQFGGESHVRAEVLSEVTTVQPGQSFWVATRLKMDRGWHIYWRNPGDTGLETSVEWELPEGFSAGPLNWPYPERIIEEPLVTYGYHGEIYLLQKISVSKDVQPGGTVDLKAEVNWLECAEVCIPGQTEIELSLPVKEGHPVTDQANIQVFSDARMRLPVQSVDWKTGVRVDEETFTIELAAPEWFDFELNGLYFFSYDPDVVKYGAEQVFGDGGNVFKLTIERSASSESVPERIRGVIVADTGWRGPGSEKALEVDIPVGQSVGGTASSQLDSLWLAVLFSFLGGIILNLMPCVLPVLSIKIMGFINQAHDEEAKPWKHGLVFTLGVLVSFWALAGILLILKAGGEQLGWGFQLQSPPFLAFLSVFMFLFGLSMFGVFEIGTSLTTVEGKTGRSGGWLGAFISGVTATIVATPCTAPFMGSALGFALTQPAWVSMMVFTFLGLGMAAPFMLLSSVPALLKFVPRPGRWMESLKQFMGFLLVATVIWLFWVLGLQAGANVVILMLINLLLTALAAWIYGRWGNLAMPAKTRVIAIGTALVILAGSNVYAFRTMDDFSVNVQATASHAGDIKWQAYSEESLQELLASDRTVFIDFTAAWCLSCQVNEQVAFGSEKVQKAFEEQDIAALKADWTSRDERITQALAGYGRNSVPLYVLYRNGNKKEPQILPEILTPGIILDAIESEKN